MGGKVLSGFTNGYAGAISRAVDDIVISLGNGTDEEEIAFGRPVFLVSGQEACIPFDAETCTADNFLGFTVRAADKTPEVYGSNRAAYVPGEPVDVLVRGSMAVTMDSSAQVGSPVYIRKADGALVTNPGAEGTTVLLPNVTVRRNRDSTRTAEIVITERNII